MTAFWMPFGLKPRAPENDEGPRYADIYERGLAAAIDITIMFTLFNGLFTYVTRWFYRQADAQALLAADKAQNAAEALQLFWASSFIQLWLANAVFQLGLIGMFIVGGLVTWHTTPGKWLMGISIRRRSDMEYPETWRYVLRYLAYIPSAPLFFWLSFNKQRRSIHDVIAGTVVIHTRPKGWYWQQVKRLYRRVREKLSATPPVE